jgi:hypothetical protein
MRKLLLALSLLLAPLSALAQPTAVGPGNAILCNQLAQATTSAATASQVLIFPGLSGSQATVLGVAGKIIVICGWHVTNATAATNGTFQFVGGASSGTTPGCTGTQTILTPPFDVTNTAPATDHTEFANLSLSPGQQLCVTTTGAVTLHIGVWIAQFQ